MAPTPAMDPPELIEPAAALIAARRGKKVVTNDDFEYARDKIMMGAERKSMIMKDEEKLLPG